MAEKLDGLRSEKQTIPAQISQSFEFVKTNDEGFATSNALITQDKLLSVMQLDY